MCQLCNSFTYINSFKPYNDLLWLVIILQMRKMRHRKLKFLFPKIIQLESFGAKVQTDG